jgi:hypothetical protein
MFHGPSEHQVYTAWTSPVERGRARPSSVVLEVAGPVPAEPLKGSYFFFFLPFFLSFFFLPMVAPSLVAATGVEEGIAPPEGAAIKSVPHSRLA